MDNFAAGVSLMYIAFFEVIAVVWFYGKIYNSAFTAMFFLSTILGARRLADNVKEMTGKKPHMFFLICWYAVTPVFILVSLNFMSGIPGH